MPQDIPATCDGCGKRFSIEHFLSFSKGGLVLAQYYDAAKEWGTLGSRPLVSSAITYKLKIKIRKIQGERTGTGAQQEYGSAKGGAVIKGEAQGGGVSGRTVNEAAVLERRPG